MAPNPINLQGLVSAVHWHSRILGFTPRPWPGNPQNPAPEGRIPALGTGQNLCFSLEGSTISAPGWQAGWGTSLAPCGCPVQRSKFSDSQFTPSNGPLSILKDVGPGSLSFPRIIDYLPPSGQTWPQEAQESTRMIAQVDLNNCWVPWSNAQVIS